MEDSTQKRTNSEKQFQHAFAQNITDASSLITKEILVIESEEILLNQRINVLKDFLETLATDDPQYAMIRAAEEMDRIELSDLMVRKQLLLQQLPKFN